MKQRPYHVLVAEDHPLTRHEVMSVLQLRDYSVLSVASPIEVAQTLKRLARRSPDHRHADGILVRPAGVLTGRATQPDLGAIIVSDGASQKRTDRRRTPSHRGRSPSDCPRRIPGTRCRTPRRNPAPAAMAPQTGDV